MKNYQKLILPLIAIIIYGKLGAQDIDVDLTDDSPAIFENPIFWIGVAVVLIIIVYMLKRNK